MKIILLEKLRKVFKSIGKIEDWIADVIIKLHHETNKKFILKGYHFNRVVKKNYKPKKIAIIICFFFRTDKINALRENILNILSYDFNKDLTIITNDITKNDEKILKEILKKIKNYSIKKIKSLPDNKFLPWYSLNIMKEKIKDKSFSHFMYLEDDIIVSAKNISYWIYFRKILKKTNLVPNFLRCETYKGIKFAVDVPRKIIKKKNPTILTEDKKSGFVNSKYPYCGMYLMDTDLLKKFLNSGATEMNYSFTNKVMKSLYPIQELVNISHAYSNIPRGYHNNMMLPFVGEIIPQYCIIKHCDLKYVKHKKLNKMGYGTLQARKLII